MSWPKLIAYFLLSIFLIGPLKSQEIIPDSLIKERIQIIQNMLDLGEKNANVWWYGWLAGYGAATMAQGAIYFSSDKLSNHQDMALGAFTTFLGMCGQLIAPMTPGYAPEKLINMPEGTQEENLARLYFAEKLLEECAKREKEGRSWKMHTLDGTVNIGCGLIVWLGFKRSIPESVINVAINTAICEAQIYTQPTRAIKDYNLYCMKYKSDQRLVYTEPKITWSFIMIPGGLGLKFRF